MRVTLILIAVFFTSTLEAQVTAVDSNSNQLYSITKNDGTQYVGTILSDDGREVLIETDKLGKIYIPKADIRSIVKIEDAESVVYGEYRDVGPFTTRYAFTTNSHPIKKGENYAMLNLYGPEVHFAVTNNFSIGIMTTWIGSPIALALKYSFKTNESRVNYSLGSLIGTSGWIGNFGSYGGIHWGGVTIGDRMNNVSFSGGFSYVKLTEESDGPTGGPIFSVAGIFKVGTRASFFFDSMISFNSTDNRTIIYAMPGMRFQKDERTAIQFAIMGITVFEEGNNYSFPLPMFSKFIKF